MTPSKTNRAMPPLDALNPRMSSRGRQMWRSLEELARLEEFPQSLRDEFPHGAAVWDDPIGRRGFLQLMGASLALAGITGCRLRLPAEKIVPQVRAPERIVPGKPLFFATAMPQEHGLGMGLLVESQMGRPIKVEGNPDHPASLGATNAFAQASILGLYDPFRSQVVTFNGGVSTWDAFHAALADALRNLGGQAGRGVRVLTETTTSPTFAAQMADFLSLYPSARWHQYEPIVRDAALEASRLAFGQPLNTVYRLDRATRIVSLGADFLCSGPASVRYAHDFAQARRPYGLKGDQPNAMSRLYVVESTPSNTGAVADHRLSLAPSQLEGFAFALAKELGLGLRDDSARSVSSELRPWIAAVADDLRQHASSSLILAGAEQSPLVQAIALAMNHRLGSVGQTLVHTAMPHPPTDGELASLAELVRDMEAGEVELLVMLGGNPVYDAPADLAFAEALTKVKFRAHLSLYEDETSAACHWHLPLAHYLESWGDVRAHDGTASIVQPLIAPLYEGRTACEVVASLRGKPSETTYDLVRSHWRSEHGASDFETFWQQSVHDGVVAGSAFPEQSVQLVSDFANQVNRLLRAPAAEQTNQQTFNLLLRADPTVLDGRYAANGWLQELPKPLTRLTWDNAFLIAPSLADRLHLRDGDHVELTIDGRRGSGPVFRLPGQPDDCITLHLGYGRRELALPGATGGIDAYRLRASRHPWQTSGATIRKLPDSSSLAQTQGHQTMAGRDLVRWASAEEFENNPQFATRHVPQPDETLYPLWRYEGYAWGMSIDLNACMGCAACVVACQAENNIPIVGKNEVIREREMHWLRIDRYFEGERDNPDAIHFQPVLCMHCEHAPCEPVCPVEATAHSAEGLNDMVYNRCVGTRYCSNNCPYKVRRFNFLQYADFGDGSEFWGSTNTASLRFMYNPDVTVRSRGVMEKCTYCVQRINAAKINAELEERKVRDGEILTACQAACPTRAIVFGDLNDRESQVARLKTLPLDYGLLTELNTRPRTTYLAKVKNFNPRLVVIASEEGTA
jgi:molybdopterin-containing oxidoreductase family iron-sulfur binding subunit